MLAGMTGCVRKHSPTLHLANRTRYHPRDPEHTPRTAPRATARLCWAGLCCWGAFLSQGGGTEGSHSPAAHFASIHSQAIPSLTPCLPHGLKRFSEVFSLLLPAFAGPHTKSSCKCPLRLPSIIPGWNSEGHEPHQYPGKEALLHTPTGTPRTSQCCDEG